MRPYAEIDPTREDHEGHSDRERPWDRKLLKDVHPVVGGKEIARQKERGDEKKEQAHESLISLNGLERVHASEDSGHSDLYYHDANAASFPAPIRPPFA